MHRRGLVFVVGAVITATGLSMLLPVVVALGYREPGDALALLESAAIAVVAGGLAWKLVGRTGELSAREGFAAVALSWFAVALVGSLPYLISGAIDGPTNAFFESAAGFTTTGSSILPDPALLGKGMLLWRAQTQWLGGMGIIVLGVAILPLLGVGAVELARAESPGHSPDRLTPRFRETAKRLWWVYAAFTGVEVVMLCLGDMSLFDAVAHAFTTMSTGGFSTDSRSLAGFSAYSQWVVIVFMLLAGVSFALHFRGLQNPREYARNSEFRLYLFILGVASVFFLVGTLGGAIVTAVRNAVFTAVSLVTTTGFATADFGQWAVALQIGVVGLMFLGGMAGSTAGGVKTFRLGVLTSAARNDLRRIVHPRGVFVARLGRDPVSDAVVESVQSFFLFYVLLFGVGVLFLGMILSQAGSPIDVGTAASAVASALGNIGPGIGEVGPAGNYLEIPATGKWLLSFLMIMGRLEIFPVLLLLTRELWRK
ncbi:MAG: TrkH family potassium uptake protein [Actinobacteria bacterium]|nr:TrkH family potassium uptake protein [Actinomycetota bacterium]MBU1492891.1 TrkH family potassium uptake protein [Actinomycetota bacterium]MBU1865495.1 TrkH family potassium uptake protein [Actinomycetota bacterium]